MCDSLVAMGDSLQRINHCSRPIELKYHSPQPFQITGTSRIEELLIRISSDSWHLATKFITGAGSCMRYLTCSVRFRTLTLAHHVLPPFAWNAWKLSWQPLSSRRYLWDIFSIDNPWLFSKQINIKSILLSFIKYCTYHNLMKWRSN